MVQRLLLVILLFLYVPLAHTQSFLHSYPSVVGQNLGYAEAIENLGMSALHSPALGFSKVQWQAATSFRQLSFGEYALSHFQAGFKMSFRSTQHWGLQLNYTGNSAVGVFHCSTLYGRRLFERLNIGARLNYGQRNAISYETAHQISMDIALSSEPVKNFFIGAWARQALQINGQPLDHASLLVSTKYQLTEEFRVYLALHSGIATQFTLGTGIYYRIIDQLDMKFSYLPNQGVITLGLGLPINSNWGIHSAAHAQAAFGIQPSVGVYYQKYKKSQ